jgi:hypothetical protein
MRSRTPAVKAFRIDGLHCESNLNPHGSRVAVTEARESAIRLPIFSRVAFASSMKYLLSSEPFGRWLSSFIFCKESTTFLMFFTLRSCKLTISAKASSGGIALHISGFCLEMTASFFFSSFFTV